MKIDEIIKQSVIENLEVLEIIKPFLKIEETGDDLFPFELSLKPQYVSNRSSLYINADDYEKIKKWLQVNSERRCFHG